MFSVIFEVLPNKENWDDYLDNAKMLRPELEQVEGFVDNIRYKSLIREGWILSLSNWRDEKSLVRWRTRMRHHEVQQKGRDEILADYHLRVGQITADNQVPVGTRDGTSPRASQSLRIPWPFRQSCPSLHLRRHASPASSARSPAPARGLSPDTLAHDRCLRGDGFGDGFGGRFSLAEAWAGGISRAALASDSRSVRGSGSPSKLRVAGSSPASGAPSEPSSLAPAYAVTGDGRVLSQRSARGQIPPARNGAPRPSRVERRSRRSGVRASQ